MTEVCVTQQMGGATNISIYQSGINMNLRLQGSTNTESDDCEATVHL